MGIQITLKNVNTAFLNAFERRPDSENSKGELIKGKFEGTFLLGEDHPQLKQLEDAVFEAVTEVIGEKKAEEFMEDNYGFKKHSDKCSVKSLSRRDKPFEDFETGMYIVARSKKQPKILTSKRGEEQVEEGYNINGERVEGEEIYSGCLATVSLELYYVKEYKNLCAEFRGIKYVGEGKRFGQASAPVTNDELEDDEDDSRSRGRNRDRDSDDRNEGRRERSRSRD